MKHLNQQATISSSNYNNLLDRDNQTTIDNNNRPSSSFGTLEDQNTNDPLLYFNVLKDLYSQHIETLTQLKKQVFSSQIDEIMDQQQKSKIRIAIESLLIDLNEEIFAISEELTKSVTYMGFGSKIQIDYEKKMEFEDRKRSLLKKIRQNIDDNASIKILRRNLRIQQHSNSPPQRDTNSIQVTQRTSQNQQIISPHANRINNLRNSGQKLANGYIDSGKKPTQQLSHRQFDTMNPPQSNKHQKKSPIPLRRKDNSANRSMVVMSNSAQRNQRSTNNKKLQQSASKKQLVFKTIDQDRKKKPQNHKLEEFERFLNQKQQQQNNQTLDNKENQGTDENISVVSNIQLQDFAKDFTLLKNKFLQLQQELATNVEKTERLEEVVDKLKTENLKLSTDIKIIRNEHSEILHKVVNLDKRNQILINENDQLRKLLGGNPNFQQPVTVEIGPGAQGSSKERKLSPFNNFLYKDTSITSNDKLPQISNQKPAINRQNPQVNAEFLSFQPSLNQNYQQNNIIASDNGLDEGGYNDLSKNNLTYQQTTMNQQNLLGHNPSTVHNPLLSISNDRILQSANTNHSRRFVSGHFNNANNKDQAINKSYSIQDTPSNKNIVMISNEDDTPRQMQFQEEKRGARNFQIGGGISQSASQKQLFNNNQFNNYITPNSNNGGGDQEQLSDWVLERMKLNK